MTDKLTPELRKTLTNFKRKYQEDFIKFYDTLIGKLYHSGGFKGKKLEQDKKSVEDLIKHIERLLDNSFPHDDEEIEKIKADIKSVDIRLKDANEQLKTDTDKSKETNEELKKQGLETDSILKSSEIFISRTEELTKEPDTLYGKFEKFQKGYNDSVPDMFKDILGEGVKSLSGFGLDAGGTLGRLAGTWQGIEKGKKDKKEAKSLEQEAAASMTSADKAKAGAYNPYQSATNNQKQQDMPFYVDSEGVVSSTLNGSGVNSSAHGSTRRNNNSNKSNGNNATSGQGSSQVFTSDGEEMDMSGWSKEAQEAVRNAKAGGTASQVPLPEKEGNTLGKEAQEAVSKPKNNMFGDIKDEAVKSAEGPFGGIIGRLKDSLKGGSGVSLTVADLSKGVSEGLNSFFNGAAMSAKWTKSIYDAVIKQEDIEDEEKEEKAEDNKGGNRKQKRDAKGRFTSGFEGEEDGKEKGGLLGNIKSLFGKGKDLAGGLGETAVGGAEVVEGGGALGGLAALGPALGAAAPWLLGGAAVAGLGVGGYELWKHFRPNKGAVAQTHGKLESEESHKSIEESMQKESDAFERETLGGKTIDEKFWEGKSPETRKRLEEGEKIGTPERPYNAHLEQGKIVSESASTTTAAATEKNVPIDTTSTDRDKEIENLLNKINETLEKIEEDSKKTQTVSNSGRRSGYDAYNLRDPLLASLNTGTLDLS